MADLARGYYARRMVLLARRARIDLRIPVVLALDGAPIVAETRNISLGGAFVATWAPALGGRPISLKLTLPGLSAPIVVRSEVRWVRANEDDRHRDGVPGMGIKFVKLPVFVAAALDQFVRARTTPF